jgi:hypothetical protein
LLNFLIVSLQPKTNGAPYAEQSLSIPIPIPIGRFHVSSGEIFRPPENSVPQTIVFRFKEIGGKLCTKHRKKFFSGLNIL